MNKKEFVALYAEKAKFESKAEAERKLDTLLSLFEEVLVNGDEVNFIGWGKFEVKDTPARVGRNPKTGEEVTIAAKKVVKFKAGKGLADKVDSNKVKSKCRSLGNERLAFLICGIGDNWVRRKRNGLV